MNPSPSNPETHPSHYWGRAACPHGDPSCPCPDGDACHHEGENPMTCPKVAAAQREMAELTEDHHLQESAITTLQDALTKAIEENTAMRSQVAENAALKKEVTKVRHEAAEAIAKLIDERKNALPFKDDKRWWKGFEHGLDCAAADCRKYGEKGGM